MSELVSTNWLFKNLDNKNLVILDCSWFLPIEKKIPKKSYIKSHIKGSYFFDIDQICDRKSKFPHMVPDLEYFKKRIKYYNIKKNSKIIAYGSDNIMGPARVWWMFKYFGFKNIYVLNGGLNKWISEKKSTTNNKSLEKLSNFNFKIKKEWLTNKEFIIQKKENSKYLIFDARSYQRFKGIEKETRKNVKAGNIKGSKNLFWKDLTINANKIVNKNSINKIFCKHKIKNKKIIVSCGSGISACVLSLSLMHGLDIKASVYDGSWSEWGFLKKLDK